MRISKINNDFISWCNYIHPDINPYIFFRRHQRYSNEYLPFLKELMENVYTELSCKLPNINFSFKGRIKSKRSFLIKSFKTMAEGIEKLFPNEYPTDNEQLKFLEEQRNKNIEKYFKFLLKDHPPKIERYLKIKNMIETSSPELGTLENFRILFSQLTPNEQENLVIRLGRTEDTFANRIVVKDVDFNIKSITTNSNGQLNILDDKGNTIPIFSSIQIPSDQIFIDTDEYGNKINDSKYTIVNGERKTIDELHLLYDNKIPSSQRTFNNALKTSDGKITLLQDLIVIDNQEQFDILSTYTNTETGDIMIVTHQATEPTNNKYFEKNSNIINLSNLLRNGTNVKFKKFDKEYTEKALYDIQHAMYEYYDEIGVTRIWTRSKDYVKSPKHFSKYQSLHDSYFYEELGYSLETQIRNLEMERNCENPQDNSSSQKLTKASKTSHDAYKKEKMKKWLKNPILSSITQKNPKAFDSSTEVLQELLYNPDVALSDLLPQYIIATKLSKNTIQSYIPEIPIVFKHLFQNPKAFIPNPKDKSPHLDFSNYKNFIRSLKKRNDARSNGNYNIDFDYL